jgi:hypothetical protein
VKYLVEDFPDAVIGNHLQAAYLIDFSTDHVPRLQERGR